MRAPGETPGMYALECAMDELAIACDLDPIELRARNEPEVEPETGVPWSSHGLVACLREGDERFGWAERDPTPAARREGRWLVGTGVASSTYPSRRRPSHSPMQASSVPPHAGRPPCGSPLTAVQVPTESSTSHASHSTHVDAT